MKANRWAIILAMLVASNLATGYVVKKNARPKVDHQRDMVEALAKMGSANGPFIVIIGDSLTQNAHLPAFVCGIPLINAGISGSRASTFIPFAEEMAARQLSPALVVVALGINDAISGYLSDFRSAYGLLIDSLPKSQIALATLAPVNRGLPEAAKINQETMARIDGTIREIAPSRRAAIIDLGGINGMESPDGIHPTESTYALWNNVVVSGIKSALRC
jgi:lysophospholipase L1-like esterase